MENEIKIRAARAPIVIGIIVASLFLICAVVIKKYVIVFMLSILMFYILAQLFFSIDFTSKEICVNYCFIKRRISARRIKSIQFVSINKAPYLIICIDGHRSFNDNVDFRFFFCSRKVISITVPYLRSIDYTKALSVLYDNVVVEKSFLKWAAKIKGQGDGSVVP